MSTGLLAFSILVTMAVGAFAVAVWHERQSRRERLHRERESSRMALELHPTYQQKVAADRAYERQTEELQLKREKQIEEIKLKWAQFTSEDEQRRAEFALKQIQPVTATAHQWLYLPPTREIVAPPELLIRHPQTIVKEVSPNEQGQQDPLPEAPRFRELVSLVSPSSIPLCWTTDGAKMGTFRDLLSMGLIGRPERGKTTALLYYVCILLLIKAEIWIWDLHGSMSALRGLNYFDSFDSIIDSIPALNAELEERDELYHEVPKRIKHPIVLLVDELPALAGRYNALDRSIRKATPSPLLTAQTFTLEARKWNGFTFLAGQSLPYSVLPTLARDNLSSRIIFECSADHAQQMQLQKMAIDTMLPRLRGAPRGTHIADFSTWSAPLLADIPFTDESDLEWVLARCNRSPFTEERTFERRTGPLGRMSVNTVNEPVKGGEWVGECGEYSPQTVNSPTPKVNVSPEEKAQILAGAHAQLQVSGDEKVKRSQLRDALGWNNKMFPKIKQVLDQEGL